MRCNGADGETDTLAVADAGKIDGGKVDAAAQAVLVELGPGTRIGTFGNEELFDEHRLVLILAVRFHQLLAAHELRAFCRVDECLRAVCDQRGGHIGVIDRAADGGVGDLDAAVAADLEAHGDAAAPLLGLIVVEAAACLHQIAADRAAVADLGRGNVACRLGKGDELAQDQLIFGQMGEGDHGADVDAVIRFFHRVHLADLGKIDERFRGDRGGLELGHHIGTAGDDGVFLFEHRNRFFNGGGTIILVSC